MEDDRYLNLERLSKIWYTSRTKGGKSQEYMSMELGVARKTIQNWEKGVSAPDIEMAIEWFRVLGVSPLPFLFQYVFPDMERIETEQSDVKLRNNLIQLVESLPMEGVKQLLYLFYGDHGSSPRAILHLINAHLQTPMKDRLTQARVITNNYELAKKKGKITHDTQVKPDINILNTAMAEGERAVLEDRDSYVMPKRMME